MKKYLVGFLSGTLFSVMLFLGNSIIQYQVNDFSSLEENPTDKMNIIQLKVVEATQDVLRKESSINNNRFKPKSDYDEPILREFILPYAVSYLTN